MKRIFLCLLVCGLILSLLVSCQSSPTVTTPNKGTTSPDSSPSDTSAGGSDWSKVDFGKEELIISVSAGQSRDVTYCAADRYIKGPDDISGNVDEVQKKVYNRNHNVEKSLNLTLIYQTTSLTEDKVEEDVAKIMQSAESNAPDIYNNDFYGLSFCMMSNYLWNVANPGIDPFTEKEAISYLDLESDGWYTDFMLGLTMNPEKVYLLAGDYFIDIVRMSWALYVNANLFNESFSSSMGYTLNDFYENIKEGEWDYDTMLYLAEQAFRDTNGTDGKADLDDAVIGLMCNSCSNRFFPRTTGIATYEWTSAGVPKIIENNTSLTRVADAFYAIYNTNGVYYNLTSIVEVTSAFMKGNVLFATAQLGEMESEELRNVDFKKGVLPIPKFDLTLQESYHTEVHDQAEVGAILNSSRHFTAATAFLQCINEQSADVLNEYYENALKIKFADDRGTRDMIDLIHDSVDAPQEELFAIMVQRYNPSATQIQTLILQAAQDQQNNFASSFANNYSALSTALDSWYKAFDELD